MHPRLPLRFCCDAAKIAFAAAGLAVAVHPLGAVTLDATAAIVSDYRFRGVSLSDRQPVLDATAEATLGPWFVGGEVVSGTRIREADRLSRRNAEIDVSAGWSRTFGLLTPSAGAVAYLHPGGGEAANGEVFASLAGALGPATLTAAANYAPDQTAARGGNLYLSLRAAAAVPTTPLTLRASVGRERGAFAGGATKVDYAGGVEATVLRRVTLGLSYVGNDLPTHGPGRLARNREDGIVARAAVRF